MINLCKFDIPEKTLKTLMYLQENLPSGSFFSV